MSALKQVRIETEMQMRPDCHPETPIKVLYCPARGGDLIKIKCGNCYRIMFEVRCPKEKED